MPVERISTCKYFRFRIDVSLSFYSLEYLIVYNLHNSEIFEICLYPDFIE